MSGCWPTDQRQDGRRSRHGKFGNCSIANATVDPKIGRNNDLVMLAQFNAQERTARAFQTLFQECDPRFDVKRAEKPKGSAIAIVEAVWNS